MAPRAGKASEPARRIPMKVRAPRPARTTGVTKSRSEDNRVGPQQIMEKLSTLPRVVHDPASLTCVTGAAAVD